MSIDNKQYSSSNQNFNKFVFARYHFNSGKEYNVSQSICSNDSFQFKYDYLRNSGSYTRTYPKNGSADSIVHLELTAHPDYFLQSLDTACYNLASTWRGKEIQQNGIYYDSLTSQFGCDSVFMLDLKHYPYQPTTISLSGNLLQTNGNYDQFQWVNCFENFQPINGADQGFYLAPHGGLYGLITTDDYGCVDTSNCIQYTGVGIDQVNLEDQVRVYPNPARSSITLHCPEEPIGAKYSIVSVTGKTMINGRLDADNKTIAIGHLTSGVYSLKLFYKQGLVIKTLVVQ